MSSLRNAVKRRTHKERSQPSDRNRLGLLEKHKDYVLRAKDYHRKEKTLQVLKEKAALKNPDEFYYKMINSRLVDGVHRSTTGKQYSQQEMLLMKTQDVGYLRNKLQSEQKKVAQLTEAVYTKTPRNIHIYYDEDRKEAKEIKKTLVSATPPVKRKKSGVERELQQRSERAETMKRALDTLTLQRQIMGKGTKRKLPQDEGDTRAPVYKWRQERKK